MEPVQTQPQTDKQQSESAQASEGIEQATGVPNFLRGDIQDIPSFAGLVVEILLILISLTAFLGFLYGGFKYLTAAGGDPTPAKKMISSSLIALVLAAISLGIIQFVISGLN